MRRRDFLRAASGLLVPAAAGLILPLEAKAQLLTLGVGSPGGATGSFTTFQSSPIGDHIGLDGTKLIATALAGGTVFQDARSIKQFPLGAKFHIEYQVPANGVGPCVVDILQDLNVTCYNTGHGFVLDPATGLLYFNNSVADTTTLRATTTGYFAIEGDEAAQTFYLMDGGSRWGPYNYTPLTGRPFPGVEINTATTGVSTTANFGDLPFVITPTAGFGTGIPA